MKTNLLILLSILYFYTLSFAQKENNVWVYGDSCGLDFNSGSPVFIKTSAVAGEGTASISDTSGNLLFYNDGEYIFDRTHTKMPSATGLIKNTSSFQGTVIVPLENKQYYVFGLDQIEINRGRFFYHKVDMTLNGGYGDIVAGQKNLLLADSMGEKIAVAPTCDGIWVIVHHLHRPIFYAYKVLYSGIIEPPVISGTDESTGFQIHGQGSIAVSNNAKMIAVSYWGRVWGWRLFHFDSRTGMVEKTSMVTSTYFFGYNFAFSHDDSKLYIAGDELNQYDLSLLPSAPAVLASRYHITGMPVVGMDQIWGLRRGPDKKIYFLSTGPSSSNMSCINKPELAGVACDVSLDIPSLKHNNRRILMQLGNPVAIIPKTRHQTTIHEICSEDVITIEYGEGFESCKWQDGDTAGSKTITHTGTYTRESHINYCVAKIDTYIVKQKPFDTTFVVHDTALCFNTPITLSGRTGMSSYLWNDGDPKSSKTVTQTDRYWVLGRGVNCQAQIDSFTVLQTDFDVTIDDMAICKDREITVNVTEREHAHYLWQDGSSNHSLTTNIPGIYWVSMTLNNCSKSDTFTITQKSFDLDLGPDRILCKEETGTLSAPIRGGEYLWNTGSTEKDLMVTAPGLYYLTVKKDGCSQTDSISITFKQCNNCIALPNAFTPNGDSKNDLFGPLIQCQVLHYELLIVNRYGQKIFSSSDPSVKWNGTFNNKMEESGVYYYLVKVLFDSPGAKEDIYRGDVTMLR